MQALRLAAVLIAIAGCTHLEAPVAEQLPPSSSGQRTIDELKSTIEANKLKVYSAYNRALARNPGLAGKVTYVFVIAPSGRVTHCTIKSSELGDPTLEAELMAAMRSIDFGSKGTQPTTVTWPVAFLPTTR